MVRVVKRANGWAVENENGDMVGVVFDDGEIVLFKDMVEQDLSSSHHRFKIKEEVA